MDALPEAPTPQSGTAPAQDLGRIYGAVVDSSGALLPGATVTLRPEKPAVANRSLSADQQGRFSFNELPAGNYVLTIAAPGMETLEWPRVELRPGEHHELPEIALPVARSSEEVSVTVTNKDLATEELKTEEHQRVLGVFPNFYTSFQRDPAPLDAGQKFNLAAHSVFDPVAFATTAAVAAVEHHRNTFPGFGIGPPAFGKRYGAAYGDLLLGRFIGSAILPSVFRQDPRYFYLGEGTVWTRARHAVLMSVIARHDTGRWEPNYSHILGNAMAGAISTVYHPAGESAAGLAGRNALIGVAGGAAVNLVREFLLKPFTHGIPPAPPKPGASESKPAASESKPVALPSK